MYNIIIGGAAGDGIETMAALFEKILQKSGYYLFSMRDFMSRVRGGHNFALIRFSDKPVKTHRDTIDGLVVLNEESYELHKHELAPGGFVLCDSSISLEGDNIIRIDMRGMAKQAGNFRASGSAAVGALLKLFGLDTQTVEAAVQSTMAERIREANITAVQLGYDAVDTHFSMGSPSPQTDILVTGAQAMSMGALAGGVQFYSAYPMSPSTTILTFLQEQQENFEFIAEQAEDEIAAINMALGASATGARAMVGTSGGGFALMVEAMGFAGIAELPVVMVDVMRPGPATGLPTRTEQSDLLFMRTASQGEYPRMIIAVRNAEDAFYQTARAFYFAQRYQIPVVLLSDQYIADSAITIPPLDVKKAVALAQWDTAAKKHEGDPEAYKRYAITDDGISPLLAPGETIAQVRVDSDEHTEEGVITEEADVRIAMVDKRARKLDGLVKELQEPNYYGVDAPETLLVGWGSTEYALEETVRLLNEQGEKVGVLCFGDIMPLPQQKLQSYKGKVKRIVNVEQNATGQLDKIMREEALIACDASILKYDGRQMSVDYILDAYRHL